MEIAPIYKRLIGLDVHQAKTSARALTEPADGTLTVERREFGAFKRDRWALARWALEVGSDVVVMESTGICWKSPCAALEAVGIAACIVNARHVKAGLARVVLLCKSSVSSADSRHLRLIARQRQKPGGMLASENNRLHKLLADVGIRLKALVSDIHGQAGRTMVKALIKG